MPTGNRPTEEIADYMSKVTLVPNVSYLFSVGTQILTGCKLFFIDICRNVLLELRILDLFLLFLFYVNIGMW